MTTQELLRTPLNELEKAELVHELSKVNLAAAGMLRRVLFQMDLSKDVEADLVKERDASYATLSRIRFIAENPNPEIDALKRIATLADFALTGIKR